MIDELYIIIGWLYVKGIILDYNVKRDSNKNFIVSLLLDDKFSAFRLFFTMGKNGLCFNIKSKMKIDENINYVDLLLDLNNLYK